MKTEGGCKKPFVSADLASFDKVADGRLYLSEIDDDQLTCIVDHLIYTKDQELRDEFLEMVKNDLWEAIRARLIALKASDDLPADVSERIDHLLSIDYSDSKFIYSAEAKYSFGALNLAGSQEELEHSYSLLQHGMIANGNLDGRFNVNDWKLTTLGQVSAANYWTSEDSAYSNGLPSDHSSDSYWGIKGGLLFGALRRDETVNMSAYFSGSYFHKPPPGTLKDTISTGGSIFLDEIGGSPFSANANVDFLKYDNVGISPDLLDPEEETLTIDAEASYMFERAGLLLAYSHEYIDSVELMRAAETNSDSGSLLAHVAFKNGFVRLGAGGGYWREKGKLIDGESDNSSGAEIHGDVSVNWSPVAPLILVLSSSVYANHSEGTFVGWFPSAVGRLDANLKLGDVFLNVGGEVEGFHRDLNLYQKMIEYSVHAGMTFTPEDYFNVGVNFEYSSAHRSGYEKYDETNVIGSSSINYRIIKKPDLWIKFKGEVDKTETKLSAGSMDTFIAQINTSLYLKYQGM
jgi:hypothetical protein